MTATAPPPLFVAHARKLIAMHTAGERIHPDGLDWARYQLRAQACPACKVAHVPGQCKGGAAR